MVMSPLVHESSPGFTLVQAIANSLVSATIIGKIMTGSWHDKELNEDLYDEREVEWGGALRRGQDPVSICSLATR